jgi:hypothetical protein
MAGGSKKGRFWTFMAGGPKKGRFLDIYGSFFGHLWVVFGHLWPPINVLFCLCARRFLKNVDFRVLTEMLTFHFFDTKKL